MENTSQRGRLPKKHYDKTTVLQDLISAVGIVYEDCQEIKFTAAELGLAELKVKKLLITAGMLSYTQTEEIQRLQAQGKKLSEIIGITGMSRASINSYLPYTKIPYKADELTANADRCDAYRKRKVAAGKLLKERTAENLWRCMIAFQEYTFHTATGLPFSYKLKKGKSGEYTRELFVDRMKDSKSLSWGSVLIAFEKADGKTYERPKALSDSRGISYLYPMFYRLGLINVPEKVRDKMCPIGRGHCFVEK